MPDTFETEIKLGLPDESAWRRVRDRLGPGQILRQSNHFMDVPDRAFRRARIGIRLRAEESSRILTAKGAADSLSSAITRRIELESQIPPADFDRALEEGLELLPWIESWRTRFGADPQIQSFLDGLSEASSEERLYPFGHFSNLREICPLRLPTADGPVGIEIELDRTEYPGGRVDYEIEVEAKDADGHGEAADLERIHRALILWLDREVGVTTHSVESKLSRLNAILDSNPAAAARHPPGTDPESVA